MPTTRNSQIQNGSGTREKSPEGIRKVTYRYRNDSYPEIEIRSCMKPENN